MKIRNASDGIVTISKKNIASSRDAALLTRDTQLQPGAEMVIYDFIANELVSLQNLIADGKLVVVNDDQPLFPPSAGSSSAWTVAKDVALTADGPTIDVTGLDLDTDSSYKVQVFLRVDTPTGPQV